MPQDNRPTHIVTGFAPASLDDIVSQSFEMVQYLVDEDVHMGQGAVVRTPRRISRAIAARSSFLPRSEFGTLLVDEEGISDVEASVALRWIDRFTVTLCAWIVSDEEVELGVTLRPAGAAGPFGARSSHEDSLGFAVVLPQAMVCASVPLKEGRLAYLDADDFFSLWPTLLAFSSAHGFRDRPWVAAND